MKSQQHKTKKNILKCSKSILIIVMLFIAGLSNSKAQSIQYPKVEEGTTDNGKHYQIIKALDEDGTVFRFQLFDDEEIGLKMMYGNVLIQFAK